MPAALTKAPKTSTTTRAARSGRLPNRPSPERTGSCHNSFPGVVGEDADVVVRAGVDTVEAERAVHVARLPRLEQVQLAAGDVVSPADAVLGPARRADDRVAHLDFQRRDQRLHEVELADRADILAEGCAAEEAVDDEGGREVGQDDPGGPPGTVPESERLVSPQEDREQERPPATCSATSAASSGPAGASAGRASAAP